MPGTGFSLGEIISVYPPLGSSAAGPHSFLESSPVLLIRYSWKMLSTVGRAITPFLA